MNVYELNSDKKFDNKKIKKFCAFPKIHLILLLIITLMANITNAQNDVKIVGLYNLGSTSPEGGSHLFVLENGNFAITYFGGIKTGKWEKAKRNTYIFTPNKKEIEFELFGRHNKDLKGDIKISFNGFEESQTFIQLRREKEEDYNMQQVFNTDANCFSYPYVYLFNKIANSISFMSITYGKENSSIITFKNTEGYNDFISSYIEIDTYENQAFFATFKGNQLYFEDDNFAQRTTLDEDSEDVKFINIFIDKEMNQDTIYLNPSYNMFGAPDSEEENQDINEHYVFNEQKNAFIDASQYIEGSENIKSDESFDNMSIIYAYKALKKYTKKSVKYKINEKPLFQVNCD